MTLDPGSLLPKVGSEVFTACGTCIQFQADTPRAPNGSDWIFFCQTACKTDFERDPKNSCLPAAEVKIQGI